MVRIVLASLTVPSLRDVLSRGHTEYVKLKSTSTCDKPSFLPRGGPGDLNEVKVQYPVGSTTLQVTGAYFSLRSECRGDGVNIGMDNGVVVLLQAHVIGELDASVRVFTVAAAVLGGRRYADKMEVDPSEQSRKKYSSRSAAPSPGSRTAAMDLCPEDRPLTAFVKLDLRLQMERISFSLRLFPVGGGGASKGPCSKYEDRNASVPPATDCSMSVTVVGVVSPLTT